MKNGNRYALLGGDVTNSYSRDLHKVISEYSSFKYDYDLISVAKEDLSRVLGDQRYSGFNVTMPYKQEVMGLLDEVTETAAELGAVNTIVRSSGKLVGYNTDVDGFVQMAGARRVGGCRCIVMGSGGAGAAVCAGLRRLGASSLVVASRSAARGCAYDDLALQHGDAEVIVNATPVGMYPRFDAMPPVDLERFPNLKTVMDIIYNPLSTKFLRTANAMGVEALGGLPMLVWQGVRAAELWESAASNITSIHDNADLIARKALKRLLSTNTNIVVIGMPGSGKSSISRRISRITGRELIDVDRLTRNKLGSTIPEAIEQQGEEYFREVEAEAVAEAGAARGAIIATGGGSVLAQANRSALQANGIVLYLDRPNELLATKGRPLTSQQGVDAIYQERAAIYREMADIIARNDKPFGGNAQNYNYDMSRFAYQIIRLVDDKLNLMVEESIERSEI